MVKLINTFRNGDKDYLYKNGNRLRVFKHRKGFAIVYDKKGNILREIKKLSKLPK